MPVTFPMYAEVTLEPALFRRREASPNDFAFGAQRIDDRTPIVSSSSSVVDVTPKAPHERACAARIERGNNVERRGGRMHFRKAAAPGQNVHRPAMTARLERNEHVERRVARTDDEHLAADAMVVEAPRIAHVTRMETHFQRKGVIVRQDVAGREYDGSGSEASPGRFDDKTALLATAYRGYSVGHVRKAREFKRVAHDLANVVAVKPA
jgi:hypothetical protein